VASLGLLAGCDGSGAPDDVVEHPRAAEIARIVPAEEALANVVVATLDPRTMNDAEIRKALGTGPRCEFRYTSSGKPVLAVGAQPIGPPLGGVVKLNGHLVPLEAAPANDVPRPDKGLLLTAGPIRMTIVPGPEGDEGNGVRRREAEMVFEVGESLRVGYRGYLGCRSDPPVVSRR
jgi:hypothetical protein